LGSRTAEAATLSGAPSSGHADAPAPDDLADVLFADAAEVRDPVTLVADAVGGT
jgi:hypothetical protein